MKRLPEENYVTFGAIIQFCFAFGLIFTLLSGDKAAMQNGLIFGWKMAIAYACLTWVAMWINRWMEDR